MLVVKRMKCVFYSERTDKCVAEMTHPGAWKVDEQTKKAFCTMNDFIKCPRYLAKMSVLTTK